MEYEKLLRTQVQLFKNQVQENKQLKSQIHILETILRNYIPVIDSKEEK